MCDDQIDIPAIIHNTLCVLIEGIKRIDTFIKLNLNPIMISY